MTMTPIIEKGDKDENLDTQGNNKLLEEIKELTMMLEKVTSSLSEQSAIVNQQHSIIS